jgi:diacylglycerol kinase (ATP)
MRICLYWNHTAGGGLSLEDLTSVIERAGHSVVRAIDDESDLPSTLDGAECVVVAGGDGTVARAGRVLAGGPVPLAILPLGTANNIASGLEIRGDIERLAARWHDGRVVKIDVGVVEGGGSVQRFLESVGCGLVASCIAEGKATLAKDHPETHLAEARELYLKSLRDLAPRHYDITLDGERLSREFLLVEILNTPSIGPKLELTTDVNAADGLLSVVLLGESDRDALVRYLTTLGADAPAPAGFRSWRVKTIEIAGADRLHVDDRVMATGGSPFSIGIHPRSLAILA